MSLPSDLCIDLYNPHQNILLSRNEKKNSATVNFGPFGHSIRFFILVYAYWVANLEHL